MSTPRARPLGVAVLGCADVAWRRTLPALAAAPGVAVAAVASRDPARARRFCDRFGGAPLAGYAAALEHPGVDAVYLPLPPALRAEWVERALRAGKHVLAEKPLTTSAAATAGLLELAATLGRVLMESFAFVHHAQHHTVRALLADGAVGEPRHFEGTFTFPPPPGGDIRYRPELGGGALLDAACYPIRAALHLLGGELRLAGAVLRTGPTGVDLSGSILAAAEGGVTASFSFGMEHAYRAGYEVWGSLGRLRVERAFTVPPTHPPVLRLERQDHVQEITLAPDDQMGRLVGAFAAAVQAGTHPGPHAAESLRQARLVDQASSSALRIEHPAAAQEPPWRSSPCPSPTRTASSRGGCGTTAASSSSASAPGRWPPAPGIPSWCAR